MWSALWCVLFACQLTFVQLGFEKHVALRDLFM